MTPKRHRGDAAQTWVMVSDRQGDRVQAETIARATRLPYVVKSVVPEGGSRKNRPSRTHAPERLDPAHSSPLTPPWPRVIIAVGHWAVRAALWVQEQSGWMTRLVLVGRPRPGEFHRFDLVIASSHYVVPPHARVIHLGFAPLRPEPQLLQRQSEMWRDRLAGMARPLTAVFVGGQTKPFRLDERLARILARDLMDLLRSDGGSLFVATSPRTAPGIAEVLKSQLGNRAVIFDWATNPASDNPYHALLRLADRIIVTGDSISMIVEAASLGRPLAIYPLPRGASVLEDLGRRVRYLLFRPRPTGKSAWNTLGLAAHRVGLLGFPRDLEAAHRRLFATGRAVPFGHPFPGEDPGLPDELDIVGLRIRAIHAEQGHNPGDARARI